MTTLHNDMEKYRKSTLDVDMKASLWVAADRFGVKNKRAVVELAIIFTLSYNECIQLEKYDLKDVDMLKNTPVHVMIAAVFDIKRKSFNPNTLKKFATEKKVHKLDLLQQYLRKNQIPLNQDIFRNEE